MSGKPWLIPGRHFLNLTILVVIFVLGAEVVRSEGTTGLTAMLVMTAAAAFLGVHLVAAIGGADMPVVVSLLNSYSGWTAAAAGFMLSNDLLIITGALVGSSGAILSYIMCKAMNRSIWNVVFGGFGATPAPKSGEPLKSTERFSRSKSMSYPDSPKAVVPSSSSRAMAWLSRKPSTLFRSSLPS